jgi:integrase/recombinase XerD
MSTVNGTHPFVGALAPVLEALIAEKRGLGYHYEREVREFARLSRFCDARGHDTLTLPRRLVEQWTAKQPHETESNRQNRLSHIRTLGQYMQRCGYPAWVPPHPAGARRPPRYQPYIFTRAQIAALLAQADACPPDPRSPDRCHVLPLLFRLLYGSGLRVSEALALRIGDVDLHAGTVHIRQAKLDKERRIPVHASWIDRVRLHETMRPYLAAPEMPMFPGPSGAPYAVSAVYEYFRRFLWAAGISHGGRGHGPRLHDLRHTFAVHCLQRWVSTGVDLTVALPYLSAYLGHTGLQSTQDYLRLTAECYPEVQVAVERHVGHVVPGGGGAAQ